MISPLLGLSWPVISFMNVDLPAPFGPSSPVMPGGTRQRHVVQADHLAVPLGQVLGGDDVASRDHLDAADAAFEHEPEAATSSDDHQQRHGPRRVVARRQPEDHVADLREIGGERRSRRCRIRLSRTSARRTAPAERRSAPRRGCRRYRLLFESDDSASIAADTMTTSTNEKSVIAGNRKTLLAEEGEVARERDLHEQQHDRRHPA